MDGKICNGLPDWSGAAHGLTLNWGIVNGLKGRVNPCQIVRALAYLWHGFPDWFMIGNELADYQLVLDGQRENGFVMDW